MSRQFFAFSLRMTLIALLLSLMACAETNGSLVEGMPDGINDSFLAEDMDVEKYVGIFEGESRDVFARREAIVSAIGLKAGDRIADIGAGTGFFAALFDRKVGTEGAVYAVEISPKFIAHLRERAKSEDLEALRVVEGTERSVELEANSIDIAFICDVYHHFEYPRETLASLMTALRPGGSLIVIDFKRIPGQSQEFILKHVRAGQEVFSSEIEEAGFVLRDEIVLDGLEDNYILRFDRSD
jgi:predicted methyltransferase